MLTPQEARAEVKRLFPLWRRERVRLDRIDRYLRGEHAGPFKPREAGSEYAELIQRSTANMLPLVVDVAAQNLYVEGYRGSTSAAQRWEAWQANGMDRRQSAVHRAALSYGLSYVLVLPGAPYPVLRGVSPRRLIAAYEDPAADEWPVYALRVDPRNEHSWKLRLYDDQHVYTLVSNLDGNKPARPTPGAADEVTDGPDYLDAERHGAGVCPVARFADSLDLEGRARGQVEPLIILQDRLDQTVFDLLMTQTFVSWKVRTVSGIALPDEESEARARKLQLAQDRFLVAEDPDTKFGELAESPLTGFLDSIELVVRQMATVSQTPPHYLLGQMANLSAEALAAAEAGLSRKIEELKHSFGEGWEQVLGLAGALMGAAPEEGSDRSQAVWRDTESRSLSQVADALGKLAAQLGVPAQLLWERIPGFTQDDVERAKTMVDADPMTALLAEVTRQQQPVLPPAGPGGGVP